MYVCIFTQQSECVSFSVQLEFLILSHWFFKLHYSSGCLLNQHNWNLLNSCTFSDTSTCPHHIERALTKCHVTQAEFSSLFGKIQSYIEAHEHMIYFCFAKCFLYSGKVLTGCDSSSFHSCSIYSALTVLSSLVFLVGSCNIYSEIIRLGQDCWQTHCVRPPHEPATAHGTFTKWDD